MTARVAPPAGTRRADAVCGDHASDRRREGDPIAANPGYGARVYRALLILLLAATSACATNATSKQLRTRAAFDLACDEQGLEVVELDPRTRGVTGCGKRATYVEQCKPCANGYAGCECTWIMNTDAR